jgi:hypothetical protein
MAGRHQQAATRQNEDKKKESNNENKQERRRGEAERGTNGNQNNKTWMARVPCAYVIVLAGPYKEAYRIVFTEKKTK